MILENFNTANGTSSSVIFERRSFIVGGYLQWIPANETRAQYTRSSKLIIFSIIKRLKLLCEPVTRDGN